MRVRYITHLSKLDGLTEAERRRLELDEGRELR